MSKKEPKKLSGRWFSVAMVGAVALNAGGIGYAMYSDEKDKAQRAQIERDSAAPVDAQTLAVLSQIPASDVRFHGIDKQGRKVKIAYDPSIELDGEFSGTKLSPEYNVKTAAYCVKVAPAVAKAAMAKNPNIVSVFMRCYAPLDYVTASATPDGVYKLRSSLVSMTRRPNS